MSDYDLEQIMVELWEPVLGWIQSTGRTSQGEAEEVRQEVFERLMREIKGGKVYPIPVKNALFRITGWVLNGYIKKKAKQTEHEALVEDLTDHDTADPTADSDLLEIFSEERLIKLFDKLPPKQREVCVRFYIDDEDVATIAEDMGITENYVHQLHYKARETLRDLLDEEPA